ncbi:MAG: hypothetical protein QOE72_2582 [Chloroflexota bacterium]|nr:hypothetical protein [Chloroflexota bacterium]
MPEGSGARRAASAPDPTTATTGWKEVFAGGSEAREAERIRGYAVEGVRLLAKVWAREHAPAGRRALHAKTLGGVENARFVVSTDLPAHLRHGLLEPGATYPASVRFSNASSEVRSDRRRDLRGMAVRIHVGADRGQDLLLVNWPASAARDARQLMAIARAMIGRWWPVRLATLLCRLGPRETLRVVRVIRTSTSRPAVSLATERFWSQTPFELGTDAVRFMVEPRAQPEAGPLRATDDCLREDLIERLRTGPVAYTVRVQPFRGAEPTGIEDATAEWATPFEDIGQLVIERQDLATAAALEAEARVDALAFTPWHTRDLRPLGSINRALRVVCDASDAYRDARPPQDPPGRGRRAILWVTRHAFGVLNGPLHVAWHRLPLPVALLNASALRAELGEKNLFDTAAPMSDVVAACPPRWLGAREPSGVFNDLRHPCAGSALQPFARNVPLDRTAQEAGPGILDPSPREISTTLLARPPGGFVPATGLNLLAAAWIQFQVHDWAAHERGGAESVWEIPVPDGDPDWPAERRPMRVPRTPPAATCPAAGGGTRHLYRNRSSHWWDGSEVYGSDPVTTWTLRAGDDHGKLRVDDGRLPLDATTGRERAGFTENWWLGLDIMQTLFALEHNAIVDRLRAAYPAWSSDQLFETARLVNAAVIAKIHVLEWTPAILTKPVFAVGERANWWGLEGPDIHRLWGRLSSDDVLSGIPGSPVDQFGVPFAMTEEFVAVYRLHPLLPDDIRFFSVTDGGYIKRLAMRDVDFERTHAVLDAHTTMPDAIYSFGIANPGAITLHNYPGFLRALQLPRQQGGHLVDLAAVDVMRDRERGVPHYNEFRRLIRMPPAGSFADLTDNREWAEELRRVYRDDIERVDLMVGMMAEKRPPGFGFSETAFRIFLLMAYRRLKSDRFFTTDYNAEAYTPEGMEWIDAADMASVLLRHYPELRAPLQQVENPFAPWLRVGGVGPDPQPPLQTSGREVERAPSARARSDHGDPAPQRR